MFAAQLQITPRSTRQSLKSQGRGGGGGGCERAFVVLFIPGAETLVYVWRRGVAKFIGALCCVCLAPVAAPLLSEEPCCFLRAENKQVEVPIPFPSHFVSTLLHIDVLCLCLSLGK